jgi:hypothetical protein
MSSECRSIQPFVAFRRIFRMKQRFQVAQNVFKIELNNSNEFRAFCRLKRTQYFCFLMILVGCLLAASSSLSGALKSASERVPEEGGKSCGFSRLWAVH